MSKPTKQVIVWNNGLRNKSGGKIRAGKFAAQISHASMAFITRGGYFTKPTMVDGAIFMNPNMSNPAEAEDWMENSFTKVVLKVNSDEELLEIYNKAKSAGLEVHLITDAGRTEFNGPTRTCVGIGPNYSELVDAITGHLELM